MENERLQNLPRFNNLDIKSSHPNYLSYYHLIKSLKSTLKKYTSGRVLDIGCGNKPYAPFLNEKVEEYIGCDVVQSSFGCVDYICLADNIPLESETFNAVISTQTIEHVGNYQGMLTEAYRLLAKGGYCIISGPMYWPLHEEPYDFHRFTKYGFEFELKRVGFEIIEINPNGGQWALFGQVFFQTMPNWLLKPKFIKRVFNRLFLFLDLKYPNFSNTMNYVVVAKKQS